MQHQCVRQHCEHRSMRESSISSSMDLHVEHSQTPPSLDVASLHDEHNACSLADELVSALDGYEDLPFDLILDTSADVEFAPLVVESPTPTKSDVPSSPPLGRTSDSSNESSNEENSSSFLVSPTVTNTTARVPRSRRLKAERDFLLGQITELQRALATLENKHATRHPIRPRMWRSVAKRQLQRRSVVEAENERLRAKVLRQLQVAKSLQVVLDRRGAQGSVSVGLPLRGEGDEWMKDLGQVFRQFSLDIAHAYGRIDTVLPRLIDEKSLEEAMLPRSVVKAHIVNGKEQLYVETRQAYVLPFGVEQVSATAWPAFTSQFVSQQRQLELYCETKDLFAVKIAGMPARPDHGDSNGSNVATATFIAKSYLSLGRNAIVWRGFIGPQDSTLREAAAVSTGWLVIQQFEGIPDCAIVHVCIRTVPKHCDLFSLARQCLVRLPSDTEEVGVFMSQKLCTLSEDISMVVEQIENILLDDATGCM